VGPDGGRGGGRLRGVGQAPAIAGDGLACDRVEANGADVVAERVPKAPHGVDGRGGEPLDGWVVAKELAILRHDPVDLRLLEHDLRYEDAVWMTSAAPRQVAAVLGIPIEEASLEA